MIQQQRFGGSILGTPARNSNPNPNPKPNPNPNPNPKPKPKPNPYQVRLGIGEDAAAVYPRFEDRSEHTPRVSAAGICSEHTSHEGKL